MTARPRTMPLRVAAAIPLSPTLKAFTLIPADGGLVPPSGPGAHLRLNLPVPGRMLKNAYSLISNPADRSHLAIIVRRVAGSKGGSAFLHEEVEDGDVIEAGLPANLFPVVRTARRHLMVSGGIGLTPFLAYIAAFEAAGTPWELHHFCRPDERGVFEGLLARYPAARVHLHCDVDLGVLDEALLRQPLGTHFYTCGPALLMDTVMERAAALGWPRARLHSESFGGAAEGGEPFIAVLRRSGLEVAVGADTSLLAAIEAAGVEAPCLCRGGACGQCLIEVAEGIPEHRDHFLDGEERASNRLIMTCVSRSRTARLVLDL
ncbi:PDR/VanB family oxidoreductase [Ancylobacter amanitiformis]|uniref:Ferredoxin-NADP reductase n=1 Tax=Ancylobacter amanitiformis TaxID=217069 RepID=A0ABU0LMF2_9HYPH|nr:PDR/VanB family oxidoreductase [Ancylobacter amanitiformis]MDQ0509884.1 ferredoxin-NADP reductase [Ancylobacter amanitiformis]